MTLFHLILVAAVQGITEFLPVSSSGHLILVPLATGLDDQGLAIDIAAHVGSLGAVILYFRRDVASALAGAVDLLCGRRHTERARLALCLTIATIPVIVAGGLVALTGLDALLRDVSVIAMATIVFALVLLWADRSGKQQRPAENWRIADAAIMGLWQVLALIPGASRSAVTIAGARRLGFNRPDAARLSMLMSIPTILAAGSLATGAAIGETETVSLLDGLVVAAASLAAALLALRVMMRLLERISFAPYVIYRIALGIGLLAWAWA